MGVVVALEGSRGDVAEQGIYGGHFVAIAAGRGILVRHSGSDGSDSRSSKEAQDAEQRK